MNNLLNLIDCQGEPFSTTSIYAQYQVFQKVKESGIKVTLEGQGADELLAGYSGFPGHRILSLIEKRKYTEAIKFYYHWLQWPGRSPTAPLIQLGKIRLTDKIYNSSNLVTEKLFIPSWINHEYALNSKIKYHKPRIGIRTENQKRRVIEELYNSIRYRSLPALLRHSDRNSMNFSIESRVPFLTKDLAEFCFSMPEKFLISNHGETKSLFRSAMKGIVPENILYRKDKIGFVAHKKNNFYTSFSDISHWIESLRSLDIIDSKFISTLTKKKNIDRLSQDTIWRLVNFSCWYHMSFKSRK